MIAACILVAGSIAATIPGEFFTLRRTHSIETISWEEDYRVAGDALVLTNSRVRGSGAGMQPQPGAQLRDGVWHRREELRLEQLALTRSRYADDYTWCNHSGCRPLSHWLGTRAETQFIEVRAGARCKERAR
ncbi:MAG: DUF1850 domain-containing protein [Burkholderiaceae bacterium]|nr:DUF1850 domain-containing protein [Burkholderiaceae bacterium]